MSFVNGFIIEWNQNFSLLSINDEVKKENKKEFYKYSKVMMLEKFNFEEFLNQIENANILVDFDARTGHNHGTKFRIRQDKLYLLYKKKTVIIWLLDDVN